MATSASQTPSASLYVGDLDREITEAQLYELFSQVGPVASIRVCRDAETRRSLGYAYVNYNSAVDEKAAERAMEALNYQVVNGKPIRIMWSHRDPSTRRSGVGNIFIKNLDESIDHKALHDTFSAFGAILSCKISTDPEGKSRGYGFVHYESEEAANLAIEKVNGMLLEGKKVFVGKFQKRVERQGDGPGRFTNVFVKNLDPDVTDEMLSEKFAEVGIITNAVVMRDERGNSKGFGFVNFQDAEAAAQAVEKLNGAPLGAKNKAMFVNRAMKKTEREQQLRKEFEEKKQERVTKFQNGPSGWGSGDALQQSNLYVKNLDESIDDEKLKSEFAPYGTIASAKVMRDEKGTSRGFGFVCFGGPEEATRAITEANGKMVNGRPIYVALAQPKEVRRATLQQQFALRMVHGMAPTGAPMPAGIPGAPGGPPAAMFPGGPPLFYAPPGMLPGAPGVPGGRQGIMYQPMMPQRGGWNAGGRGMGPGARPGFQPMQPYNNSIGPRQRYGRGRPGGMQHQQPGMHPQGNQQPNQQPPHQQQQQLQAQQQQPQVPGQPMGNGMLPGGGMPMPMPVGPMPVVLPVLPTEPLNPTLLAAAPPAQQKQMLGERLFPLIQRHQPELAGKITGMLLEMDNSELLLLLESPEALLAKVEEALMVLRQHSGAAGGAVDSTGADGGAVGPGEVIA